MDLLRSHLLLVNLCQKLLFLYQLTHNKTTDCSWNYHDIYKRRTWIERVLPMFCACSFLGNSMNNLLSYCGLVDATISASEKDLPVRIASPPKSDDWRCSTHNIVFMTNDFFRLNLISFRLTPKVRLQN